MTKSDMVELLEAYTDAVAAILHKIRDTPNGNCYICNAATGIKHTDECVIGPLILARSNYRMRSES